MRKVAGKHTPGEEDVVRLVGNRQQLVGDASGGGRQGEELWVARHDASQGVGPLHIASAVKRGKSWGGNGTSTSFTLRASWNT